MHFKSHIKISTTLLALFAFLMSTLLSQELDYLPKAPFYKNYKKHASENASRAYLHIAVDAKVYEEFFYQGRDKVLQSLVDVMNHHLDTLNVSSVRIELPAKGRPYVFAGSSEAETAPPGSEMMREEYHKFPPMVIYMKKPSKEWKAQLEKVLLQENAEYLAAIWIGFAEYPKANKGLFKKKVVLGTNYEPEIRFLSAEDKPVEVLQLTGMLLNRKGDVLRAGAEGIIHEDTPFWAQVFEIKKSVDDKAIQELIANYRREDLPTRPLAWQEALNNMLDNLLLPHRQAAKRKTS